MRAFKFLELISPLNNAEKIAVLLSIAHDGEDSLVPVLVSEALRLWDIASEDVDVEVGGTGGVRVGRPRCGTRSTGHSRETDAQRLFLSSD